MTERRLRALLRSALRARPHRGVSGGDHPARRGEGSDRSRISRAGKALAFIAYAVLAVIFTWPLSTAPARLAIPHEDLYNGIWSMTWVVHQATRDPLRLFEGNIYYPHPHSLAYLESLMPQAVQAAPFLLLGAPPLLAHNVVYLLTFALSGLGAFLLALELSGSRAGAFLAGVAFGFCSFRFSHIVHIQCLSVQWLPFALLFLHRAVRTGRPSHLIGLGAFSLLQALSSGYYAFLTAVALGLALVYYGRLAWQSRTLGKVVLSLAAAALLAAVAFLPYRALQQRQGLMRSRTESIHWSARWRSYLDPGRYVALPHLLFLRERFETRAPLYAGAVTLGLGAVGLTAARRAGPARLMALLTAAGVLLSLGPEIQVGSTTIAGPFGWLRWLPGATMLRTPSRMGVLAALGIAVLAAIGWARCSRGRLAPAGAALLTALLIVESFPAGLRYAIAPVPSPPLSVRWLAAAPRGPVLELPWDDVRLGGLYSYWSTMHWQPIVNGYGAIEPPGSHGLGWTGRTWPSRYSARVFREHGIRYVVVHTDRAGPAQKQRIFSGTLPEGVRVAEVLGPDWIYVIEPEPGGHPSAGDAEEAGRRQRGAVDSPGNVP